MTIHLLTSADLTDRKAFLAVKILLCALLGALLGCKKPVPAVAPAPAPAMSAKTDPHWVFQDPANKKPIAVVFIHGIFGDTTSTWTNEQAGTNFFKLLHENASIGSKVDIYAFGFSSKMVGGGSLNVSQAAKKLDTYISVDGVKEYDNIVFVAHSMGGLVAMQEIVSHPEIQRKVPLMMFFGTPQEGSEITAIAKYASQNPGINQMIVVNNNDYLRELNDQWTELKAANKAPNVLCGYETKKMMGVMIVPWNSATKFCTRAAPGIEDADHLSIVKPNRARHQSVMTLVAAMQEYVLPRLDPSSWKTDDLRLNGAQWEYTLKEPFNVNLLSIRNTSGLRQAYSVTKTEETGDLYISPEDSATEVPPSGADSLSLIPLGKLMPEYRFQLKLGSLPPRMVVAKFGNLEAARVERAEQAQKVIAALNMQLGSDERRAEFEHLSPEERYVRLADVAKGSISVDMPASDEKTKWLLTADTLSRIGVGQSALVALENAQSRDPSLVSSPSIQRLASKIAVQPRVGQPDFQIPATQLDLADYKGHSDLTYSSTQVQDQWLRLAENMQQTSGLKLQGLILKGDVLQSQGKKEESVRTYIQARNADSSDSPFFNRKIQAAMEPAGEG